MCTPLPVCACMPLCDYQSDSQPASLDCVYMCMYLSACVIVCVLFVCAWIDGCMPVCAAGFMCVCVCIYGFLYDDII